VTAASKAIEQLKGRMAEAQAHWTQARQTITELQEEAQEVRHLAAELHQALVKVRRVLRGVVVPGGRVVPDRGLGDRERYAAPLHLGVRHAPGSNEFRASHLTPDEVLGVIHDTHPVRFPIPNAKLDVVRWQVGHGA
jgi:hypothetical protein